MEAGKHFNRGDEGVISLGPLELLNQHVFDQAEDEFPSLALRRFECYVVAALGLVYRLLSGVERCLLIVVDR